MEKASNIGSSHTSSKSKFFDKEMLKEILTMRDLMKGMCEDRNESIALEEQLMAMKKEKDQLLQRNWIMNMYENYQCLKLPPSLQDIKLQHKTCTIIPTAKTLAINGNHMSKTNYALIPPDLKIEG